MRYVSESDADELYDQWLDEIYGEVKIAGLTYSTSSVLKEIDPIAYRCGMVDFLDAEDLTTDPDEADEEEDDADTDD